MDDARKRETQQTQVKVKALLTSAAWIEGLKEHKKQKKDSNGNIKERPNLKKLQGLLKSKDLPPLRFLDAAYLKDKPIPRSDHSNVLTKAEDIDVESSYVFFVSHRWFKNSPDDDKNSKAKSLYEFSRWFALYWHGKDGQKAKKVYLWMDYFGLDQDDMNQGIQCLPLYVSACSGTIEVMGIGDQHQNHGYYTRAWCLLEAALAYRFQLAGAAPFVVPLGFELNELEKSQYKALLKMQENGMSVVKNTAGTQVEIKDVVLDDPRQGDLSVHGDRKYIVDLTEVLLNTTIKFTNRQESTNIIFGTSTAKVRHLIRS